ncbi:MAG: DNA polymerase/3'-5' exonuclease PolX [Acidobacteria bacterium]|nr:DNA polymerase/3'-5' exonuclease PolX [Acidobacteriota bacterium]
MTATSRIPLGRAQLLASTVIRDARRLRIGAEAITPVGSLRRFAPDVGDVSLLAVAPRSEHRHVLSAFARLPIVANISAQTSASLTASTERGDVTLHVTSSEHAGAALVWHTGSRAHVERLRQRAARLGLRFQQGWIAHPDGSNVSCPTEEDVYARLDLPYIAPELRDGGHELDAAERGELPRLVAESDIRGDLHMHSTWSDGRDTIADMVSASKQLGYEYVAISDHSERAQASRALAAADVARQREEIDALRARAHGIDVLHGIEVDIMRDGSLDFPDALLEGFDFVLASLHDHGGQDGAALTERYLRAIRHPLVNVITHPTNRAPGRFDGYQLDLDRLFTEAAANGTAMEIDGAPAHLDLDGPLARRAAGAGVTIVIDSDAHRTDGLGRQMRFGVGTARRGWIEPRHVLNTRTLDEVRAFVARKRARQPARG